MSAATRSDECIDVLLGRVERGHPPHHARLRVPDIEGVPTLQLLGHAGREGGEDPIGLDRVGNGRTRYPGNSAGQPAGHPVGMVGIGSPQVLGQQGHELGGYETHLRGELHRLLPDEPQRGLSGRAEGDDRLGPHGPVLGRPEGEDVDPGAGAEVARGRPRDGRRRWTAGRRRDAATSRARGPTGRGRDLLEAVAGADLGGLGDRHHPGLDVVLVARSGDGRSTSSGVSFPSGVATGISLLPRNRSGAPHSSTLMWALSAQMTASKGRRSDWSPTTLAPVPLKVKHTSASWPKCSRKSSMARGVTGSAP